MIAANERGFTLIELVLVIVLIGIVAVAAMPNFIDISAQAEDASVRGLTNALRSAIGMAKAQWMIQGQPTHTTLNGASVGIFPSTGYAECIGTTGFCASGALDGRSADNECADLWNTLLHNPPPADITSNCNTSACEWATTHDWANPEHCIFTSDQGNGTHQIFYYYQSGNVTMQ